MFGIVFTTVLYLGLVHYSVPRTGSVSYEIGMAFCTRSYEFFSTHSFTIIFFSITCFFAKPRENCRYCGKILTPIKLTFIGILVVFAFIHPMGEMQAPAYTSHAFFKGFQEGYLTMDTLASFVFGIIIINAIKEKGAKQKDIMIVCAKQH